MHTLVCKIESKWGAYARDNEAAQWSRLDISNVLRSAIDVSLNGADLLKHPWTFSERQASEIMADLLDAPEQTLGVAELRDYISVCVDRALDIMIYAPEGRLEDAPGDRWASLHRPPRQRLWSSGLDGAFRPQALRQHILGFFGIGIDQSDEKQWKSFLPGKFGVDRPTHLRELWVRPAFRARQLCPDSFPEFKPGPIITPEMEAKRLSKMPMHKSAVRRLKHQQNAERFRKEADERRALREQQGEAQ